MGGVAKAVNKVFGGGSVSVPKTPDVEAERKKAEEEALRKRVGLVSKGMSGTIMGGSVGAKDDVSKKKLLGE